MDLKTPQLILMFFMLAISACSSALPPLQAAESPTQEVTSTPPEPSHTPSATNTAVPTATFTPTPLPPTATPTRVFTPTPDSTQIPLNAQLRIFENLWTIVKDTYVYQDFNGLDWDSIRQEFSRQIRAGLTNEEFYLLTAQAIFMLGDDHSIFLNPQQVAEQETEFEGNLDYVGIGVLVSAVPERDRAVILSVFPGSPAEGVGLQPRDSIISVDGTPILDEDGFLRDIVRGPEGTRITVSVQTPGEESHEVQVTRHRISGMVPVLHEVMTTPEGKRIGYILLVTFDDSTVDEQVAAALQQMSAAASLDGLILDNRMNGGGSSTVLEPMLGYFIGGEVGYFSRRFEERPLQIEMNDIRGSSNVPLVVLVGPWTASFGEIFAGILQNMKRAYLIGTATDGNVEILWGYDLEDGSRLWLANETFRPYNDPYQDWEQTGIMPDLMVSGEFDEYKLEDDPAVIAAIQYLSSR